MSYTAREGRSEQAALADTSARNAQAVNRDGLSELVKHLHDQADIFKELSKLWIAKIPLMAAMSLRSIAAYMREHGDALSRCIDTAGRVP